MQRAGIQNQLRNGAPLRTEMMETPFSWLAFMILMWRLNFNLCYFSNIPAAIVAHLTFSHSKTDDTDDTNGVSTSWQVILLPLQNNWALQFDPVNDICLLPCVKGIITQTGFQSGSSQLVHNRSYYAIEDFACLVCFCLKKNYILNFHPCKACRSACITIHSFFVQL